MNHPRRFTTRSARFESVVAQAAIAAVSSLLSACALSATPIDDTPLAAGEIVSDIGPSCWIVFQDADDHYWFGTDGSGVCRYDGTTLTRFTTRDGLCNDHIRGIQQHAPSGDLLITTCGGVSRFDGRRFTTLQPTVMESSELGAATGWTLDPDDVWLPLQGRQLGPFRYDGKTLYHLKFPKSPRAEEWYAKSPNVPWSPYEIYCVYKDRAGTMWFGTGNLGICRFDGKTRDWMYEPHLTELPGNRMLGIRSILEDRDGAFWFTNTTYRYRMTPRSDADRVDGEIAYTREPGVDLHDLPAGENPIYFQSAAEDERGDLWMATYGDGVWRWDGKAMKHHVIQEGGAIVTIFSIYRDRRGDLWLGTHEHGVWKFDGEKFARVRWQ